MFKLNKNNIVIEVSNWKEKYMGPIYVIYSDGNSKQVPRMVFNVYVSDRNKVVHIYDALDNHTTSIINKLNEAYLIELCNELKINIRKYEFYIYTPPVSGDNPFTTAYDYRKNDFYKQEDALKLCEFIKLAKIGDFLL